MSKTEIIYPLNTFGGRIQDRRINVLKLTRPKFYDLIRPDENTLNDSKSRTVKHWESGKTEPDKETLIKICKVLRCSSDYLLGLDTCITKDNQFIHDQTGLSDEAIETLKTNCIFKRNRIIDSTNTLICDMQIFPGEKRTRSFIELFSNYVSFSGTDQKKYSLDRNGDIHDARPRSVINGKAYYDVNKVYFSSRQLEQMFIMEMEDIIKALKEYKNKAPNTN